MDHKLELFIPILEILEIEVFNILPNPGNTGKLIFYFSHLREILEICFLYILGFFQKRCAPKFHAEWSGFRDEISHMRPIQGQKLKLFQTPILNFCPSPRKGQNLIFWNGFELIQS